MNFVTSNAKYIWLGFTVLFLLLAAGHALKARHAIPHFVKPAGVREINGMSTGVVETVAALNGYLDKVNADTRLANIMACVGYVFAALTALVSYWLTP